MVSVAFPVLSYTRIFHCNERCNIKVQPVRPDFSGQWWMQDLPDRRAEAAPKMGVTNLLFWSISPENCMKTKAFELRGKA